MGLRRWLCGLGRPRLGLALEQGIRLEEKTCKVQEEVKSTFPEGMPQHYFSVNQLPLCQIKALQVYTSPLNHIHSLVNHAETTYILIVKLYLILWP